MFKKFAPLGGVSESDKIQSLWIPIRSFNTKTFVASINESFDNNNVGVGITPYYYYFNSTTLSYSDIGEVDATGGTGKVSLRLDLKGGAAYRNPTANIGADPVYSALHSNGPGTEPVPVPNATPFQQVVASGKPPVILFGNFIDTGPYNPTYKLCSPLSTSDTFTEPGAYLVVVMRNSIDNNLRVSSAGGVPGAWSIDESSVLTTPSLSAAFLKIDPPLPTLAQTSDTLDFTVNGYGSVNEVGSVPNSNPKKYRWAITNKYAGTPGFSTPNMPYDINTLSLSKPQGDYDDFNFVPSVRFQAYQTLETRTDINALRIAEKSISAFEVRGAFLYDFRITNGNGYFNPYADSAAVEGYVNYTYDSKTPLEYKLFPNFNSKWINKVRGSNRLLVSDSTIFATSFATGQQIALSEADSHLVSTSNYATLQASIYVPVQLNAFIVEQRDTGGNSLGYAITLSWTETQSSIITNNIVNNGHVIRVYKRSNINSTFEGIEFTSNPVTGFKYNSIADTGAAVPSSAVTSTNNSKKSYAVRVGRATLYTGQASGTQLYWTQQELFGSWMVVLQRNFTPAGATSPLLVTSAAVTTLANPPAPVISVVKNNYDFPISLTTSILGVPTQNIAFSNVNIAWTKQDSSGNYQSIPAGANYGQNVNNLGSLPVVVKSRVEMQLLLTTTNIVENLGGGLRLVIDDPNAFKSGYMGPRAINQYSAQNYNLESSATTVALPNISQAPLQVAIHLLSDDQTHGKRYLFKLTWTETSQEMLTTNIVGAKNVLRVSKYEKKEEPTPGYKFVPRPYAEFRGITHTGLNLLYAYTNDGVPEPSRNGERTIYLDRAGTASSLGNVLPNFGFSESELEGNWRFILQRNFSTTDTRLLVTQGSYFIQLPTPPTLRLDVASGLSETLVTTPADIFPANTTNEWSAQIITTPPSSSFTDIGRDASGNNVLRSKSSLSLTELQPYWPLSKGASYIRNKVTINLNGANPSSSEETLGSLGVVTTANMKQFGQTSYPATYSNSVPIYEPQQTNETGYLDSVTYLHKQSVISGNTFTYFQVNFTDPNVEQLSNNQAYIVNIFKKGEGNTVTDQWNHPQPHYEYTDSSVGQSIAKTDIPNPNPPNPVTGSLSLTLHICANEFVSVTNQNSETAFPSAPDSFSPGAYLVVIRRNFGSGLSNSTTQLPFYTISSGYIFVEPANLNLDGTLNLGIDLYGSYGSTGTRDLGLNTYVLLEGVEEPSLIEASAGITSVTNGTSSSKANIIVNKTALSKAYPDSGPIQLAVRVTYNWNGPTSFTLPIGKIGTSGSYQYQNPVVANTIRNVTLKGIGQVPSTQITLGQVPLAQNQAITNLDTNAVRILIPSNNHWNYEQGNIVRDARADFIGDAKNRLLAIRWEDVKPSDLQSKYTGSPYSLRLYKKRRKGATASEQWYDPSDNYDGGMSPYYEGAINDPSYAYAGVPVNNTYLPVSSLPSNALNKSIMYIYADASGHIWYNAPPPKVDTEDANKYRPFTDDANSGGYVLVIQRNFGSNPSVPFISTVGTYLHLMPIVSWSLKPEGEGDSSLLSDPTLDATYEPGTNGSKNIEYSWNLALPNIGYSNVIPNATSARFDIGAFKAEFRNRDKSAVITSKVTYNFSVTELPFMEAYPLQYISGNGFFTATSQDFIVDLCVKPTEFPPPPWPRFSLPCPDVTPEERAALQMRRKAETLMHVSNKHERRMTKAQQYSFIARGFNQKRQTYATQTDKFTNPNTKGYPVLGGGSGLALPSECSQRVLTFPSSASDVPGPVVPLTYDPNVPLINYKVVRTYNNSQTEFYDEKGL